MVIWWSVGFSSSLFGKIPTCLGLVLHRYVLSACVRVCMCACVCNVRGEGGGEVNCMFAWPSVSQWKCSQSTSSFLICGRSEWCNRKKIYCMKTLQCNLHQISVCVSTQRTACIATKSTSINDEQQSYYVKTFSSVFGKHCSRNLSWHLWKQKWVTFIRRVGGDRFHNDSNIRQIFFHACLSCRLISAFIELTSHGA